MRRFVCTAVSLAVTVAIAVIVVGCGRTPTQGLVSTPGDADPDTTAELPDAVSDTAGTETSDTVAEVGDIEAGDTANLLDVDLCGPENVQLPNESDSCEVEGASVCGKADAFTRTTPWKPKGSFAPAWAALLPDWTCWRPQILRCVKQVGGGLRWEGEWCGSVYHTFVSEKALAMGKAEYHCQSLDGIASCCPRAVNAGGGTVGRCDPAVRGQVNCHDGKCGTRAEVPDIDLDALNELDALPAEFAQCLMWYDREPCPGFVCQVNNTNPAIDSPYTCKNFSGSCMNVDPFTTKCDTSGCAGRTPPLPKGNCVDYDNDIQQNQPDADSSP